MALQKSTSASGKKQTPMPGPNSAAYKNIVGEKKKKNASKKGKKRVRASSSYSSLQSRQRLLERVKSVIWASVAEINEAIIALAKAGNCSAAKALFEFAGVNSLPPEGDENPKAAAVPITGASEAAAAPDPVDAFFRSIGMQATDDELDSEMADAG
jgi:hypothetical protein